MRLVKANEVFQTNADKIGVTPVDQKTPVVLYYSADGVSFVKWEDQINLGVVIANIPVGLFMRFDQDCVITDK